MAISAIPSPRHTKANTKTMTPIRFFIPYRSMPPAARFGKHASGLSRALNKWPGLLHCGHEVAARGPGDDPAQCYALSTSVAAALYLRAALSANAVRCAALQPDVLGGDAKARPHAQTPSPVAGLGLIRVSVGHRDGTSHLILQGLARVELEGTVRYKPYRIQRIRPLAGTALRQRHS